MALQSTSLEVWSQKYQLKDHLGNPVDNNIEDTYKRVAKALADVEENDKEVWESKFYEALCMGAIPAGRILSNAGASDYKPSTSLINCTVSQIVEDSMTGILDAVKQAGVTLAAGCGIGYEFSTLRPKGSYVNGAGATTSGSISFMDIFDAMCFTVSSAGGRRGAQMGTMAIWHPDVEDFIKAKREDGRLRQFNLSVLVDDEFMQAVKGDGEYDLVFPVKQSEVDRGNIHLSETVLKELFWDNDYCNSQKYILEDGKIRCKVYKTLRAKDLWEEIMKLTYDFAEPGFILIDEVNRMNNLYWCENIRSTNPCQPGWAKLLTKDGIREMNDISVGDYIWSAEGWTKVVNKWSTGVKKVNKYQTTSGVFYGTENHQVVSGGVKVEAKDADSLDTLSGPSHKNLDIDVQDVMDGLVMGDGSVHKASNNYVHLFIGDDDTSYHESEISNLILRYRGGIKEKAWQVKTTIKHDELPLTYLRRVPERFMYSPSRTAGFLRGLYSANGSVVGNRITLKASSKGMIEDVQLMLSSLGIKSYYTTNKTKSILFDNGEYQCKESYDLNITTGREAFLETIGFIQKYKEDKVVIKTVNRTKKTYDINTVEFVSEEEVFDITVDNESHTYWTSGVNVSNCGEQPLPPFGSCLLGSINLTKFVENPFTKGARFNFTEYEKVVSVFTRMLDNVVELNGLPLSEQRNEIITKRRHGMGITGFGSICSMLGVAYGDDKSLILLEDIMKTMAYIGYKTGIDLAKEKGVAPILENKEAREMFVDGEYMKRLIQSYPELKDGILNHGCRFSHHTSIAPTGTISLSVCNNVSNGIEPSFSHKYTRNVIKEGMKSKVAVNVYSYELLLYKELEGIDEAPGTFSVSDNVPPKSHVDVQAVAQKWCDSSISKTINVPTSMPFEQFKDIYMYAYDNKLKGCTTFRFNPEAFQGVLVKDDDLEKTIYVFVTDEGEFEFKGNDVIEYNGEESSAANLYDAYKEGYYGKF